MSASSHREAPLIAGDPRADNTDVYAFVSPDAPDTVSLIANWLPFSEPNGGPNFYPWADGARYNIHVDNDGDAVADLTYTWVFDTIIKDPGQFLVNTGPFDSVNDATLNVYQTYDLTVFDGTTTTTILNDAIAAPSSVGAVSTPNYQPLVDEAVASGTSGSLKSFAGQADDSFFLDLRVFDLLYGANVIPEVGEDTLAGYNVNTIALQVPKAELALAGDAGANPVIGVWSTTEREVRDETGALGFVQVSRLGNPLINEVVIPLALKDTFNAVDPTVDATVPAVVDAVVNPILPELIEAIYGVPAPDEDRNDLVEIFLQGISEENAGLTGAPGDNPALNVDLNSLGLNAGAVDPIVPSEMLRLNMSIPPTASPNNFGVLAGDLAGFPNGRRLADDVVDIALQVVQGAAISGQLNPALLPFDSVDRNDRDFKSSFPYVALPHLDSVNNGTERTPRAPEIISINPVRILETRALAQQIGYTGAKPQAGQTTEVQVVGAPGSPVPGDADAVVVNVTAVDTVSDGFVTVYPCGENLPLASSFNPQAARTTHGMAISALGTDGKICVYSSVATDLVVDLMAFYPSTSSYAANVPERVLDTRNAIGYSGTKPVAGSVTKVDVIGTPGADLPADTKAVFINVTSESAETDGFVTVYSCDAARPTDSSNLNLVTGITRSNLTVSQVAADGTVCIYTTSATSLIVDLQGAAPASSSFVPTVPERVLETRAGAGLINYSGAKPIAGQTIEVKVVGFGDSAIPADAGTVYLNVTAAETSPDGFITVYPCGSARPLASNVNLTGINTPNLVAASVGDGGRVCLYVSDPTHVVADILGFYPGTILA